MKKNVPSSTLIIAAFVCTIISCSRKNYASTYFDQQTASHKIIAVLPAEIILSGNQPKNITPEQIDSIEVAESKAFQVSLQNSILRHANTRKYYMRVNVQDISTTLTLLEKNNISLRDSWKTDANELAKILKVDAVVRMQITKQRFMSDYASYGVSVAEKILWNTGAANKLPIPSNAAKTNDIYVTCNLLSNDITLWNDYYKSSSNWNAPANVIIDNITDRFGEHFPYKTRR